MPAGSKVLHIGHGIDTKSGQPFRGDNQCSLTNNTGNPKMLMTLRISALKILPTGPSSFLASASHFVMTKVLLRAKERTSREEKPESTEPSHYDMLLRIGRTSFRLPVHTSFQKRHHQASRLLTSFLSFGLYTRKVVCLSPRFLRLGTSFSSFSNSSAAIAYQVYHASKILLNLNSYPAVPDGFIIGSSQSLTHRREIEKSREQIFLVSNAGIPDTWSLVSTQCLYIAGMVTEGLLERSLTLELIEDCQKRSGRKTCVLADALRKLWSE